MDTALERLQAKMVATLTIVDRQGGGAALARTKITFGTSWH